MSTWPADYRNRLQTTESSSKSKGKAKAKNTSSEYDSQRTDVPLLRLGSRGAAALVNKNGRLEWVFAADNSFRANHRKILSRGRTLQLIPDSSTGPPVEPSITPLQRAEQETQFLRTYHPDIDVGFDILREHIIEDHEKYKDGHSFDPFQGNQMAVIELPESTEEHSALRRFLIYACGETGSQINICPFITSSSGLEILSPRIEIAHDYRTPVQQVTASGGFVAIRTNTIVFLMNAIAEKNVGSQGRTVRLELLDKWKLGDSQGNRLMDIAIRKLPDKELVQLALVDAAGGVWIWGSSDNGSFTKKLILSSTRVESKANEAATWRVCWGSNFKTILRMSHTAISVVNVTESDKKFGAIFMTHAADGHLTSLTPSGDELLWACTTTKLFLLDVNDITHPLLSWKHDREEENSLQVTSISSRSVALTSRLSGVITYHTVSNVEDSQHFSTLYTSYEPTSSWLPIRTKHGITIPRLGLVLLPQTHNCNLGALIDVYELSSCRGVSITREHFQAGHASDQVGSNVCITEKDETQWPRALEGLAEINERIHSNRKVYGPLATRESTTYDLRGAYERLFCSNNRSNSLGKSDRGTRNDADAAFETLGVMPSFWQNLDAPIQHVITTYDVAFQSGREPERRSRTDFLSGNSLNTLHGRGILVNKTGGHGLPVEQLASSAGWSWNIGNSLRQITKSAVPFPEHANDFDTTKFKRFDAKRTGWVDPVEMKREEDARNELVVDLAMSLDVYSMEPFHKDTIRRDVNDSEFVEEATNMLSKTTLRASEPSKIEYGFLRALPINQIPGEELTPIDDRDKEDGSVEPLGVRLLLQEWPLGEDPSNYTYEDPYGPSTQSSISWTQQTANTSSTGRPAGTSSRPFVSSATGMNSVPVISTSVAAPPKLLDSSMLSNKPVPAVVSKQADRWNSQPNDNPTAFSDQWPESSQSQGRAIPSTQPVPGPFGRRQGFDGKKKPKRVGGF